MVCSWKKPLFFWMLFVRGKKGGGVEDDDDVLIVWVLVRDRVL